MSPQGTILARQIPETPDAWAAAPLPPALAEEARQLVARLDAPQRLWLSGYLAGALTAADAAPAGIAQPARPPVTVIFGSQSGNAERVARQTAEFLGRRGVPCNVHDMIDVTRATLASATTLLVVVSTQGEGDPPDRAIGLWELLNSRKAPDMKHASFAVLALGDSTYRKFCETGRRFDARLEELGARRLRPRVDCDVDFDAPAAGWMEELAGTLAANDAAPAAAGAAARVGVSASVSSAWTRRNPFSAPVLLNQRITGRGSSKDVRHIELSLEGSGIRYEPGDAIGIVPRNDPAEVDALLALLPWTGDVEVTLGSRAMSLHEALLDAADIGFVDEGFLERYAGAEADRFRGRLLAEVVQALPPKHLEPSAFAALLRPLSPRLYSIASSLHAAPDEAHLTVGVVEFEYGGRPRRGLVSGQLAAMPEEGEHSLPVYLHRNAGFRLPASDRPVIMIGPGTGIAPFRAFLQERQATHAPGWNWLFFGDRSQKTDFLYRDELENWQKSGLLTRLDTAFSRDGAQKVYVQHRMLEQAAEVWKWLNRGAHVYVCGDAKRMAADVDAALRTIVAQQGGLDDAGVDAYMKDLAKTRRYQKDVY